MVAAGLGAVLSGCGLMTDVAAPASRPAPAASTPAPIPPELSKPPPPRPSPLPALGAGPAELVGMGEDDARRLLGDPRGEHSDGAARVLSYAGGGCDLDVVLFLDVSRSEWTVLSYSLVRRSTGSCYAQMRRAR